MRGTSSTNHAHEEMKRRKKTVIRRTRCEEEGRRSYLFSYGLFNDTVSVC